MRLNTVFFDDPSKWFVQAVAWLNDVALNPIYNLVLVFVLGGVFFAYGIPIIRSLFSGKNKSKLDYHRYGTTLERYHNKLEAAVNQYRQSVNRFGGPQPYRFNNAEHSELKSFFVTLNKSKVKTPELPNTLTISDLAGLTAYCVVIYPLLKDGHIRDARKEAKRVLKEMKQP